MDEGAEGEDRKDEDGGDADEENFERDEKRDGDDDDDVDERAGSRELDEPGRGGMASLLAPAAEASDLPKIE